MGRSCRALLITSSSGLCMNPALATLALVVSFGVSASRHTLQLAPGSLAGPTAPPSEAPTVVHARGTFDVKVLPQTMALAVEGSRLSRLSLDKQYHGDLDATAFGEMLAAGSSEKTSAGYVAVEEVKGTLNGRRGSFALQHSGTMTRGVGTLTITVVPDSGTEELVGLTGTLTIIVADGKHSYAFEYSLPTPR